MCCNILLYLISTIQRLTASIHSYTIEELSIYTISARGSGKSLSSDGGQEKVKVDGADACALGSAPAVWQNERGVLKGHTSVKVDDARYCELYGGQQAAARVRAEEARLNAAFDRALRLAPAPLWPELPIRL